MGDTSYIKIRKRKRHLLDTIEIYFDDGEGLKKVEKENNKAIKEAKKLMKKTRMKNGKTKKVQ